MSSLATDPDGRDAVIALLIAALSDESSWVRIGAAHGLADAYPEEGLRALKARWATVRPESDEQFALALALEICGENTSVLLAPLFGLETTEDFDRALGLDDENQPQAHDNWVCFLRDRAHLLRRAALNLVGEIRPFRRWWKYKRSGEAEAEVGKLPGRYERAANALEHELWLANIWLRNDKFKATSAAIFNPILSALKSDEDESAGDAVEALVGFALGESNGWFREASQTALARLGGEAGELLMPGLWGEPPQIPGPEQIRALASQAAFEWRSEDLPEGRAAAVAVASFFAAKALAKFDDEETVSSVVRAAVEGAGRAEQTLADMPLEVSLPALVWAAVNYADWEDRRRASAIIKRIITKDPDYGIHYHNIDGAKVDADLRWVSELANRPRRARGRAARPTEGGSLSWLISEPATTLILRHAIRLVPLIEGKVDINYMDSSAWDRFVGFTRRVFSLSRRAGLEQEGPTAVERYLSHQFPKQCVLGDPAPLTLRLDVQAPRGGGVAPAVSLEFGQGEERVRLVALVRSPGFHVKPDYGILEVPLDGPSNEVEFTLTPCDLGEQNVEVTLLRDAEPVGHACLVVNVVAQGHASGKADVGVLDGTSNRDLLRLGETRALIWVEWREDGRLAYRVRDPAAGAEELIEVGVSPGAVPRAQVAGWAEQQGEIIKGYLKEDYATAGELEGALAGIASIGHELYKQLAPPDLAELVRGWEPGSVVAVDSNEGWVPWELLSDSPTGPLWGERFQLIRVPRVPPGPALDLARVVDVGARAGPCDVVGKIASVVGDGIERGDGPGEYSARRTFGRAAPLVSELIEAEYPKFFGQVSDADIVHFTCHGRGTPYHLSLGPSAGKRLLIGQVETLRLKPGVVIFANACSSGQPELFLSEFQNFGWSFYLRGARPFIGTLGPVPTRHAITFAQHFYERFIVKGLPAGRALREARRAVAKEFRNPFYLFYCLYGPASIRRRIRPHTAV